MTGLGVVLALLVGSLLLFEFPAAASREAGAYLALLGAVAVAVGAGDFRVKSLFPALPDPRRGSERLERAAGAEKTVAGFAHADRKRLARG